MRKAGVFLQEEEITLDDLAVKLQAIARTGVDEQIFVRADTTVDYGFVMKVMGALNASGFKKLGMVTGSQPVKKAAVQ